MTERPANAARMSCQPAATGSGSFGPAARMVLAGVISLLCCCARHVRVDDEVDVFVDIDDDAVLMLFERFKRRELRHHHEAGMSWPGRLDCRAAITPGEPLKCRNRTDGQCFRSCLRYRRLAPSSS